MDIGEAKLEFSGGEIYEGLSMFVSKGKVRRSSLVSDGMLEDGNMFS